MLRIPPASRLGVPNRAPFDLGDGPHTVKSIPPHPLKVPFY